MISLNQMNESKPKKENPNGSQRRYDPKQYDMLKRCSEKKDMTEWNNWRKEHPDEDILLENRNFDQWCLKGVYLNQGTFRVGKKTLNFTGQVYLKYATFRGSNLQQAKLHIARLQSANLQGAKLQGAILWEAKLQKANLRETYLQDANLMRAHLQGAEFGGSKLQNADFSRAIVDGGTLIWRCKVNQKTKFEGVGLGNVRIYPALKQLLEYNIRRMNWEEWYPKHPFLRWPVRWFWSVSKYGLSTWRIIGWFLMLSLFFAAVYSSIAFWYPQGIVSNLTVEPHLPLWHYFILCILRPIYFSVVTMTTLGFGDMYANANSILGHLLLTIQVILGYVLLGALVTRFAILFTAGGPAGRFANEQEKKGQGEHSAR